MNRNQLKTITNELYVIGDFYFTAFYFLILVFLLYNMTVYIAYVAASRAYYARLVRISEKCVWVCESDTSR